MLWGNGLGRFCKMNVGDDKIELLTPLYSILKKIAGVKEDDYEKILNLLVALYKKSLLDYLRSISF